MVAREKIDSNETNARYAVEASIGVLPVDPLWIGLEPNSYKDFGGELTLLARRPINNSRQRKKGVITDLDASGGLETDFTQDNMQDLLQGFMFASHRNKKSSVLESVAAGEATVTSGTGFLVGHIVKLLGSTVAANNKIGTVTAVDTNDLTIAGLLLDATPADDASVSVVGYKGAAGVLDIDATGILPALTSGTVDLTTLGVIPGEWVYIGGDAAGSSFATAANNGFKRVYSVAAGRITFDLSLLPMVTEASTTETVEIALGRVLKNELVPNIVRRSYQIERTLGAPDDASPNALQSEYLIGAVPNQLEVTINQADKITASMDFVATDNEQRTATTGVKPGTRVAAVESDAFNTSSDFSFIRLAVLDPLNEAPPQLFGHCTELAITVNNNVTANKAIAVLGAFDMTAGTFEVSASVTAYFATIEAVQAVRNNEDVTLNFGVAKNNAGFVCDIPLIALGNARLDVQIDEPIMLPLDIQAATAVAINANTDYTLLWCFFDYLPTRAEA